MSEVFSPDDVFVLDDSRAAGIESTIIKVNKGSLEILRPS